MSDELAVKLQAQQRLIDQLALQQQLLAENQRQLVQMCLDLQQQIMQYQHATYTRNQPPIH